AGPLHLRQRHIDRHAADGRAVEPDRDDLGLKTGLLLQKVRRTTDTNVERRWMDDDGGAVRDVLARGVLDVTFERVDVGHARITLRLESQRGLPVLAERRLFAADVAALERLLLTGRADEHPPIRAEPLGDRGGRSVA